MHSMQVKTSLAETAGSKFLDECSALVTEGKFEDYVKKVQQNIDLVYSKSESAGTAGFSCTARSLGLSVETV